MKTGILTRPRAVYPFWILSVLIVTSVVLSEAANAQESKVRINHEGKDFTMLKHAWRAQWITHPTASTLDYGVFHFRRSFELHELPENLKIHVSADNRYRLFVNGHYVTYGPSLGDLDHYRYESLDIAAFLREGENVIAAEVVNFGEYRRAAQQSFQMAFILQSDRENMKLLDTGSGLWKVYQNPAYSCIPFTSDSLGAYYAAGPGEELDGRRYPWGWEELEYDDSDWLSPKAATVEFAVGRGFLYGSTWFLVPREIPLMREYRERFSSVPRHTGLEGAPEFIREEGRSVIPAGSKVSILVDNHFHTTGFPLLELSGGRNAEIRLTYAEAMFLPENEAGEEQDAHFAAHDRKRNRMDLEGKHIEGYYDRLIADGGEQRVFKPLSRKTYRFVQLDIETAEEALVLEDFYTIYAGYPFEEKASFESEDDGLNAIWDAAWRTLVNSSEEQFFDPYYEQLQYIGDTRIEALVSIYVSGDDRLMRKAIRQFDDSRITDGLTQSRYPSYIVQVIPTYSLLWIAMVHDYFMYRNDPDFVREFFPGMQSVLDWFLRRQDSTGMVGNLEWWNFTDWADGFANGIPPGADDGYSANVNLQLVYALQQFTSMAAYFDMDREAGYYGQKAGEIQAAVMKSCYNGARGLLAETPRQEVYSQHSQIWAILTQSISGDQQEVLMNLVLGAEDRSLKTDLIQATIYFRFYLFRALQEAGIGDRYLEMLDPWYRMLDQGMTTFGERDGVMRSECHGWSASPCFDLLHTVAGIYPLEPGFASIAIAPNFGRLEEMKVSFPHPEGELKLELERKQQRVKGIVSLPSGTSGHFFWQGRSYPLKAGINQINYR